MGECGRKGADKGGPNLRELRMKIPAGVTREEGEQDTDVEFRGDVNLQKMSEIRIDLNG